jgi:hypothetical protein
MTKADAPIVPDAWINNLIRRGFSEKQIRKVVPNAFYRRVTKGTTFLYLMHFSIVRGEADS